MIGDVLHVRACPREPSTRERLAVLEAENRDLRARVERLERWFDAAVLSGQCEQEPQDEIE